MADEARSGARRFERPERVARSVPSDLVPGGGTSDTELARRLREGDEAALSELYQRFGRPCYLLARRICVDEGLAEEVVQEVFLTLWRDPRRFDPVRGSFATWLLTLIHHKAVDAVRRESAVRKRVVLSPEAGEDWSAMPVPGADQTAIARVAAGQVREALGQLPTEQRQVLALAYFGGHTQREIALLAGVPLGTVKSRMFAGVNRLRLLLGGTLGPDCPGEGDRELAVGWALHALEPAEDSLVATHVAECAECDNIVAETEQLGALLGLSISETGTPSPELEQRILAVTATGSEVPFT